MQDVHGKSNPGISWQKQITALFMQQIGLKFNSLTPELNPSAQRCLASFFTGDFAS
jgi:hypothetical protein